MASERIANKRAALRQRVIEVALKAFAARGFESTTMTDIAEQLDMTGPALYHYFATKDALLFACLDHTMDQLCADIGAAADSPGDAVDRLGAVVRQQVEFELRHGSAAPLVNAHLYGPRYLTEVFDDAQRETLRLKQREVVLAYRRLIDEGVAAGLFRPVDTAIAAFNVLAIVQYSGVWYRPRRGRRVADVTQAQVDSVLALLGASTPLDGRPASTPSRRAS